jgi:magnesium-transporting ATPase (P-type)
MNKSFSWRVFTSFGLFLSFFMLLVSGVILYIFPGRSPGVIWEMGGLTKPAWQNQHIIFGFAFSLLSLGHLFLINWHAFLSYLKAKTTQGIKRPAELLTIVILSLVVGFGTYFGIQPFSGILEFGKQISKSWEPKGKDAPKPFVEHLTLAAILQQEAPEERHHRFDYDADEEGCDRDGTRSLSSRELAFRDEERVSREEEIEPGPDRRVNTITEEKSRPVSDVQAPDDALHRRTTKSCSSCH